MVAKVQRYRKRRYRHLLRHERLVAFEVVVQETDLLILAETDLSARAEAIVYRIRGPLEGYISRHPEFLYALTPLSYDRLAPPLVREMLRAGQRCGTGPMAAVAGAIAEQVGLALLQESSEVVVENGGDCFIKVKAPLKVGIFAGDSVLSERLAVRIRPDQTPVGVCTSSASVGHSLSFGRAEAVTVVAASAALADAAATSTCNQVQGPRDVSRALDHAAGIEGVAGAVVIVGEQIGVWGEIELVSLGGTQAAAVENKGVK